MSERRIAPGAIAAFGDDLWVADVSRPVVLRVHDAREGSAICWDKPLDQLGVAVSLRADRSGCWVVDEHGVVHLGIDGTWKRLSHEPFEGSASTNGTLATTVASGKQRVEEGDRTEIILLRLDDEETRLDLPGYVRHIVASRDGFLALLFLVEDEPREGAYDHLRIAEVTLDGRSRVGPVIPQRPSDEALLGGAHPWVIVSSTELAPLAADLTLGQPVEIAPSFGAWTFEDRLFLSQHPSGTGRVGWRPPGGQLTTPIQTGWLLAQLDAQSLEPFASTFLPEETAEVVVDGGGRGLDPERWVVVSNATDAQGPQVGARPQP